MCGTSGDAQRRGHTVLDRCRCALARESIEQGVLALGVPMKNGNELFDGVLANGMKLDPYAERADQSANAQVFVLSSLHGGAVAGVRQWEEELLFDVHVRQQPMLELTPGRLQILL